MTHILQCCTSDMLHRICLAIIDPLVSEDIYQLLDNSVICRAEAAIVCQRFLGVLDLENPNPNSCNKDRNQFTESESLLGWQLRLLDYYMS
jgi:hypothetical protein